MNNISFCGFTNWANGVTKDVSGIDCGGRVLPALGQTNDIFQYTLDSSLIDYGMTPGDLIFGGYDPSADGTSSMNRF